MPCPPLHPLVLHLLSLLRMWPQEHLLLATRTRCCVSAQVPRRPHRAKHARRTTHDDVSAVRRRLARCDVIFVFRHTSCHPREVQYWRVQWWLQTSRILVGLTVTDKNKVGHKSPRLRKLWSFKSLVSSHLCWTLLLTFSFSLLICSSHNALLKCSSLH